MFPGIDGFHWTVGHIVFLSLFFAVVVTILTTVAAAAWRTTGDFRTRRASDMCWNADFVELPTADRRCRHELAGRVISRTCDKAFNCRECGQYSQFAVLPADGRLAPTLGLNYPEDRLYHRGHAWVKTEQDNTVTVGIDEFAHHLIGDPDSIRMPALGTEIELNQTAWSMYKNGNEVRVRAPLEGSVVGVGGPEQGWYLKLRPRLDVHDPATTRHLLRGAELYGWLSREMERLQLQLRKPDAAPSLADGGVLVHGLMDAIPEADWDAVIADTFLEP